MAGEEAAIRYAQAVMAIAVQNGTIDRWRADLQDIASLLADSELAPILGDGRIPLPDRYAIIDRVLDAPPVVRNLAKLLVQRGRGPAARRIAQAFEGLADEHEGIGRARVTTAVPLSDEQLAGIEQRLSAAMGKRITATADVDSSLVGGVVLRVGDQLLDGSIRTRLRSLRRELTA